MLDDLLDYDDDDDDANLDGAVVGIDLGTTNSVISAILDGQAVVIADHRGHELQPSTVAWMPDGNRLVGVKARMRRAVDPENTVFSAKRLIGQAYGSKAVERAMASLPYQLLEGERQEVLISTRTGAVTVPTVSSHVLSHLKALAEARLGCPVAYCVITVPANFSDAQRAATRKAATLAGMEVLRILNEPTAAAIAYGQGRRIHQRIAVFDLGGGTFDVSVLAVRDNLYEVVATGGDSFLGGDDVDAAIFRWLAQEFLKKHRIDPEADPIAKARLLMAAEQIKHSLSEEDEVEGSLTEVSKGRGGVALGLDFRISRKQFNKMIADLAQATMDTTDKVLAEAGLSPTSIDEVILVGGSTRIPLIQQLVTSKFGKTPSSDLDPMKVVAQGAAIQADRMINPSEHQGVLLDVTPHSLRIATVKGYSKVLIAKNSTIPAQGTTTFFAASDNHNRVTLRVCQGEDDQFEANVPLGELTLEELPEGKRGEMGIQVAFTIDADGILQVCAKNTESKTATHATLSLVGSQDER
ncbi:MAG: Hsp70 family protein [Myxococcales bacterium]|nr:Hsp70 family protein [Myxococcales bacterium]